MTMIISGGQTGVDRAALDVAMELGLPSGGWCPRGRLAEDGPIRPEYLLRETLLDAPEQRTAWNVFDSDATLILAPDELAGGSRKTLEMAGRYRRPVYVARPDDLAGAREWLASVGPMAVLNVAGPRASEWSGAYSAARTFLRAFLPSTDVLTVPKSRTVLITGGDGYLAQHLIEATPPGWVVHRTTRQGKGGEGWHRVELSEAEQVSGLFSDLRPSLVIHTAYGSGNGDRDIVQATRNVAAACADMASRMIHISTDMVLDGETGPYSEDAAPDPLHEYGRWKELAERLVQEQVPGAAVVRVSLLTRLSPPDPRTEWVLEGLRGKGVRELYQDELRTPTLVEDSARQIWEIARMGEGSAGVWHLANPEGMSRYALGCLIAAAHGLDSKALGASSLRDSAAPRPRDLRLLTTRADRSLPTRSRGISELVSECRGHMRFNRIEPIQ